MINRIIIILSFLIYNAETSGQTQFYGSFQISVQKSSLALDAPPMLLNVEPQSEGQKIVMEIQDDMKKKGVSKRVLFNPSDSTWTMLMEFNIVKQGTRIHAAAMYRDTAKHEKINVRQTNENRIINNYKCKKVILESESYIADVWLTTQINFNLSRIYQLLSHCGMMNSFVRKGDWFNWKNRKGFIMEVTSRKKNSDEFYTISVSEIQSGQINDLLFDTKGFKISDIPEGQNCGSN